MTDLIDKAKLRKQIMAARFLPTRRELDAIIESLPPVTCEECSHADVATERHLCSRCYCGCNFERTRDRPAYSAGTKQAKGTSTCT